MVTKGDKHGRKATERASDCPDFKDKEKFKLLGCPFPVRQGFI